MGNEMARWLGRTRAELQAGSCVACLERFQIQVLMRGTLLSRRTG